MTPKIVQHTAAQSTRSSKRVNGVGKRAKKKAVATVVVRGGGQKRVFKIGETRDSLPAMVNHLQTGESSSYIVGPYGKPSVALVSYERFRPLLANGSKEERFALLIADELLSDAPQHLWTSAIDELSRLPKSDLLCLWKLTAASSDEELTAIRAQMRNPEILDRLVVRMRVAKAIGEAREAGLYEAAEDSASNALTSRG